MCIRDSHSRVVECLRRGDCALELLVIAAEHGHKAENAQRCLLYTSFPCLIVREHPKPSDRAILYFFGGGMVIGPDKGDLPVTVSYTHLDVYKRQG